MDLGRNRLGSFSLTTRRVFVGIALVPCAVTLANNYFRWRLFGRDDNWSIGASFVLLLLVMRYLGPTMQQIREYRDSSRMRKGPPGA